MHLHAEPAWPRAAPQSEPTFPSHTHCALLWYSTAEPLAPIKAHSLSRARGGTVSPCSPGAQRVISVYLE